MVRKLGCLLVFEGGLYIGQLWGLGGLRIVEFDDIFDRRIPVRKETIFPLLVL